MLSASPAIRLPEDAKPRLVVVIDTEEEFDWGAHPDRAATDVSAMAEVGRCQEIFDEYGIAPAYVVDYPVASQPEGYEPLRAILEDGRCEIGAHLHPWVNPPFDEPLSRSNMYPGNLEPELERLKLEQLTEALTRSFGRRPTLYKAGRYGVGPHTAALLEDLDYEIDLSVCPPVDYRADGGPDFRGFHCEPSWFGASRRLLELPITGSFVGWLGGMSQAIYDATQGDFVRRTLKVPAILSRLGALDRLMLSPEGFDPAEHVKLTRALLDRGVRTFTWSFHSPSVVPGHTPYVRNDDDLRRFLDMFRRYFDYFLGTLEGVATTPTQLRAELETLG